MDFTKLNDSQFVGVIAGFLLVTFIALKYLLDRNFEQRKELKEYEVKALDLRFSTLLESFNKKITDLEEDIDGLGSKLRTFKSTMESFSNTIASVSINHEKLNIRIEHLEATVQNLELKLKDMIQHEILKDKKSV